MSISLRTVEPRAVVCVIDDARRDLRVARDVLAGRFTHNGVTLTLGHSPDWRSRGLDHDDEWRVEWVKGNEGLDLAHAYAVAGDARLLAAWEALVTSYIAQIPVGHERSEVSARRVQNWLYAWQRFRDAGACVEPAVARVLTTRLRADADHLADHLTPERNHRTLELYALLLVALAFDDRARAVEALNGLALNAELDVLPDGVHRERSSDYHMIVLRSFVGAIANATSFDLAIPPILGERTQRAADVALHLQRPDGTTPALSDGDAGDFRPLLARAGRLLDRPDLVWAATAGAEGSPPTATSVAFPIGGYCVQRSGWGDGDRPYREERFGVFDCGPLGDGGHGHYDHLSVELWGAGRPLALDPGRYTYADGVDGWRHWFKGTKAHNTVCVDGLDQIEYRSGKPKAPTSTAWLASRASGKRFDVVVGRATSPRYDAIHTRSVALIDNDRWVVHDRLRAQRTHRYEARWHLAPDAQDAVVVERDRDNHTVTAPGVRLIVPRRCGDVHIEDGWISPTYGCKLPAPVAVIVADRGADADIVTLMQPVPPP